MIVGENPINCLTSHASMGGDAVASFLDTQKVALVFKNTSPFPIQFDKDIPLKVMGKESKIKKFSLGSNEEKLVEVLLPISVKVALVFKNTCPCTMEFDRDIVFNVMGKEIKIKKFKLKSSEEKLVEFFIDVDPEKRRNDTAKISASLLVPVDYDRKDKIRQDAEKTFTFSLDKSEHVIKNEIYIFCEKKERFYRIIEGCARNRVRSYKALEVHFR